MPSGPRSYEALSRLSVTDTKCYNIKVKASLKTEALFLNSVVVKPPPTTMEAFKGKYERTSAENYEEFLKALDVSYLLRKAATVSTPIVEITESNGVWSIKSSTTLKSMELKFKVKHSLKNLFCNPFFYLRLVWSLRRQLLMGER